MHLLGSTPSSLSTVFAQDADYYVASTDPSIPQPHHLCRFIASSSYLQKKIADAPFTLEVGCGQGLPSVAALRCGAASVTLHEYNHEVIELCTKGNLGANFSDNDMGGRRAMAGQQVTLVSGDWAFFAPKQKFRVVLGSDVTFDAQSCASLISLLPRVLEYPLGVAVIATKEFYFGTGGGVVELTDLLKQHNNRHRSIEQDQTFSPP